MGRITRRGVYEASRFLKGTSQVRILYTLIGNEVLTMACSEVNVGGRQRELKTGQLHSVLSGTVGKRKPDRMGGSDDVLEWGCFRESSCKV